MKTKWHLTFIAMVTAVFCAVPAIASLTFYTDRSDWEVAVSGEIVVEDFDAVTPDFLAESVNDAGLIDIEMLNLALVNRWNSIDNGSDLIDLLSINGTAYYQGQCSPYDLDTTIVLHLPSPVFAFGGDFTSASSSGGLTLEVNGSQHEFSDEMPSSIGTGFLGFISTEAFAAVTLFDASNNESFGLDNVSFAVPEPITLGLLGLGGLVLRKRRKV
jgi:hypothetical protein